MERALEPLLNLLARLSDPFHELRTGVRRALDISAVDPEMGLARSRKVLELVVRDVYERRVAEPPGTRPLENLLQRLVKDGHWPVRLEAYATVVRMLGNVGVHRFDQQVTADDVFQSLSQLHPILEWYCLTERPEAFGAGNETDSPVAPGAVPARRRGHRAEREWKRLLALAHPTDRVWPLVVEGQSRDRRALTYSVTVRGNGRPSGRPEIRLGSRVFWAVETGAEAHLLLLDSGPEGETYCLCPSWFAPDTLLRPGVTLLPPETAKCEPFAVTGVPGPEEMLAVLSDRPLCPDWMPPDPSTPARILSPADLDRLLALLRRLPPASWTALTVSCEITV